MYAENLYPNLRFGWSTLRALRSGRFKVIDTARPELYDLEHDPGERQNLFESRRDVAEPMLQRLQRDDTCPPIGVGPSLEPSMPSCRSASAPWDT